MLSLLVENKGKIVSHRAIAKELYGETPPSSWYANISLCKKIMVDHHIPVVTVRSNGYMLEENFDPSTVGRIQFNASVSPQVVKKVQEFIKANPGCSTFQMASALKLAPYAITNAIRYGNSLEKIISKRGGPKSRYWFGEVPSNIPGPKSKYIPNGLPSGRKPITRNRLFSFLQNNPGSSMNALALAAQTSVVSARNTLYGLRKLGVQIKSENLGEGSRYTIVSGTLPSRPLSKPVSHAIVTESPANPIEIETTMNDVTSESVETEVAPAPTKKPNPFVNYPRQPVKQSAILSFIENNPNCDIRQIGRAIGSSNHAVNQLIGILRKKGHTIPVSLYNGVWLYNFQPALFLESGENDNEETPKIEEKVAAKKIPARNEKFPDYSKLPDTKRAARKVTRNIPKKSKRDEIEKFLAENPKVTIAQLRAKFNPPAPEKRFNPNAPKNILMPELCVSRKEVLELLKSKEFLSVKEIAKHFTDKGKEISTAAVRQHLARLKETGTKLDSFETGYRTVYGIVKE